MPALKIAPDTGQQDLPPHDFSLPPALRMYWAALFVLSAISAFASDIYYHTNRFGQCCTLAYDDPLFSDFWSYNYVFRSIHTAAFFQSSRRFAYPAFSAVVYDVAYHLGRRPHAIYLTTEFAVCGLAAYFFFRKICRIGLRRFPAAILVLCSLLFSYPLFFLFETGNIEIFTCILTAVGLWAALKGHDSSAAVLWGAAGAMKIYPLILLALFLSRAKWRSLAVGIAAFALISVLSMWFVGPTIPIAFAGSISGVGGFVSVYSETVRTQELPFDHSLLAPMKIFAFVMAHRTGTLSFLTNPYLLIAGTTALLAFFLRARHMPVTNQILFLFAAMVSLPPVSYDYTLVHLYAPWAMLTIVALSKGSAGFTLPDLRVYFLCLAVLFTSQRFIYYHWIHPNGTFKAIALVMLMVTALRYPIPD
jgi:Glycosyltransferase family 87